MDAQTRSPDVQTPQQPETEGQTTENSKQTTEDSSKRTSQEKGPRTDAGWAWVVLGGAFTVYFTSLGFLMSQSVYIPVWMDYWDTNAVTTSLVISINILWRGLLSPVASALCTKHGPRVMTMVGGVITGGGAALLSLSPSITVLILLNLIPGFGASLVFVSALQVLGFYFHKKYSLAAGIALAGISLGQLAFPLLITLLIETYGWKGSILVTGAITLNIAVAGALMRPVTRKRRQKKRKEKTEKPDESATKENDSQEKHRVEIGDKAVTASSSGGLHVNKNGNSSGGTEDEQSNDKDVAIIIADSDELISEGNAHPIGNYTDTLVAAMEEDGLALAMDPDSVSIENTENKPTTCTGKVHLLLSNTKHFLLEEYGIRRLIRNKRFMLMLVVYFLHGIGKLGLTYTVARAKSVGIDLNKSALLLSLFGVGGLVGRAGPGWFIDKKYISANMAYVLGLIVLCASLALTPAFVVFGPLTVLTVVFGAASGTSGSLSLVTVRSLVQPCDATEALGVMLVFNSVGTLTGIVGAGLIYDNTESYDAAFFTGAAILLIAALLATVVYFLQRAHNKRHLPVARFWAKLPRGMNLKKLSKSASYQVNSEPSSSPNDDLEFVNPSYTRTERGTVENDAIEIESEGCQIKVVNPLSEFRETLSSKTEALGTECGPSPELPMGESCLESQPDRMDSPAVNSPAIFSSSTTPAASSDCINEDVKNSEGLTSDDSVSMDSDRGFENPAFGFETNDALSHDDDKLTTDTSGIAEFDTNLPVKNTDLEGSISE